MSLLENLEQIKERIAKSQLRSGIKNTVEIVAITKTHPAEILIQAYEAGLRSVGENRVQEAENKFNEAIDILPKLNKRLVGHLQSNKAKKALQLFDSIDSVDSIKLANTISSKNCRLAGERYSLTAIAPQFERWFSAIQEVYTGKGWNAV